MKKGKDTAGINFCVIIPTYNNDRTLEKVINDTLKITHDVIVVNDGSTDRTASILNRLHDGIETVSYSKNRGKGSALREGFKRASDLGYEYAVTLDSDGQHFPSDIPKFLDIVKPGEDILVIGSRDMTDKNIPGISLFGRKFSNFWVRLETGLDIGDSQSGYRLYTVSKINKFHFFTVKYDFELESLVRWIWRGYPVKTVPVGVYYPPEGERVSHFKGFKDNFRISMLNTVLVAVTFTCIIPGRLIRLAFGALKKILSHGLRHETR